MQDIYRLEREILGSLIIDEGTHDFIEYLQKDDFIDKFHQNVFKSIEELKEQKKDITHFTIKDKASCEVMDIINVTDIVSTTSNVEGNIKLLKNHSNRRKLIQKANKIIDMAKDKDVDIEEIKNNAMEELDEVQGIVNDDITTLKDAMLEAIDVLEDRQMNKDDKSLYTGITKYDYATAGLHDEELTTIAARPGVGKTAIAMQIALKIARTKSKDKKPLKVMFVSLEMSVVQMCQRIIAGYAGIDGNDLRRGNMDEKRWKDTYRVANMFNIDNFIMDKTSKNPQHIRSKIRKYKPDLVIIDYLQLLKPVGKHQSREQEVSSMTRDLKLMTLEFKIPIIMLSQLNRKAEGNRPTLADLRESGAIEQDSDNIVFLHQPQDGDIDELIENGPYTRGFIDSIYKQSNKLVQVILEKQRNGPVGTFEMIYRPNLMRFLSIEERK